jgi:uncharacterized membrane protein
LDKALLHPNESNIRGLKFLFISFTPFFSLAYFMTGDLVSIFVVVVVALYIKISSKYDQKI